MKVQLFQKKSGVGRNEATLTIRSAGRSVRRRTMVVGENQGRGELFGERVTKKIERESRRRKFCPFLDRTLKMNEFLV